jgi:hypothetical protein
VSRKLDRATIKRTESYLAALRGNQALLPSVGSKRPHLRHIAASIGVSYDRLGASTEARKLLREYGIEFGFAPSLGPSTENVKAKIAAYADEKVRTGGTIPSDPRRQGCISYRGC